MEWFLPVVGSFVLSLLINGAIIRTARTRGWFIDSPLSGKPQRFHDTPTPRAGGIGILAGLLPLLFLSSAWKILLPALFAFLSGILEDFRQELSPRKRLLLQLIAATLFIALTHTVVRYLGFGITLPWTVASLFSIFAIVGAMNAINIIDGFNGLAGGIVAMILLSYARIAHTLDLERTEESIAVILAALLGFLFHNFPKGRIFLGDGGAYLLGFLVAILGIHLVATQESVSPWYILAVLIYPVWEVLFSIIRKVSAGKSPLHPDGDHLHMIIYRTLAGKSNPRTSVIILTMVAPFILAATLYPNNSLFNFFLTLFFVAAYLLLYQTLRRREASKA